MNQEIRCDDCNTLFGRVTSGSDNEQILQIKNRDLYRYVAGGAIWGPCRGCGKRIEWIADNDSERA
jgi:hypothetical protein